MTFIPFRSSPARLPVLALALGAVAAGALPAAADTFEPNDTLAQAYGPLSPGVPLQSYIADVDDQDWYYFDAEAGNVNITLTGIPTSADYDLYLTDGEENILAFSDNLGNAGETIAESLPAGGRYWIRVRGVMSASADQPYTLTAGFTAPVNQAPSVTVLAPNGGEIWTAGSTEPVSWTASDPEDGNALSVSLAFSPDDGATWVEAGTTLANSGTFGWTVSEDPTDQALIRLTVTDGDGASESDVSDGTFTVLPSTGPAITLTLPSRIDAGPGDTVSVPFTLASEVPVAGMRFNVTYPPDRVAYQSLSADSALVGWQSASFVSSPGTVHVDLSGTVRPAGTAVYGALTFRVAENPGGNALLELSEVEVVDGDGVSHSAGTGDGLVVPVAGVVLSAAAQPEGVRLAWTVASESGLAGFRVLRAPGESELPPAPLSAGLLDPGVRAYLDAGVPPGSYRYWLEAVDRGGDRERFGPVAVTVGIGAPVLRAGTPHPNPAAGPVQVDIWGASGPVRAAVIGLTGRVVRTLTAPAGSGVLRWDGRGPGGDPVPAGIYFLRITDGSAVQVRRVAVLNR